MKFVKKTKIEIKEILCNKNIPNTDSTIQTMEELARERGSTTGNLEDYSFEIEIEASTNGMIIKRVDVIK